MKKKNKKNKNPVIGYISSTVCLIVNELLWILDPEDGGVLFRNVSLAIWTVLAIVSFIINSLYLVKLRKSDDRKAFAATYDFIFISGSIIFIASTVNIVLRLSVIK